MDLNATDILTQAASDICEMASAVGIDGTALLASLPASGTFLTGNQVPALTPKDRGKVAVLFYLNRTHSGMAWPFIQFRTFRHGGAVTSFNGLRWMRARGSSAWRSTHSACNKTFVRQAAIRTGLTDASRQQRDERLQFTYQGSTPLTQTLDWVTQKFQGHLTDDVLARTAGRCAERNRVLFPMENMAGTRTGYHQITVEQNNEKRHFVRKSGLMNGSFVRIKAASAAYSALPPIICEGVATALSLALVWPGPVFAALCAANLSKVRKSIYGPVILAADNDQWKEHVGNIGLLEAEKAAENADHIVMPHFKAQEISTKPTDFNDLLCIAGLPALASQVLCLPKIFQHVAVAA